MRVASDKFLRLGKKLSFLAGKMKEIGRKLHHSCIVSKGFLCSGNFMIPGVRKLRNVQDS